MFVDQVKPRVHHPPAALPGELLVFLAVAAFLAANLPFLEAWPAVHNDEAREMNAFWVASGVDPSARSLDPEFGPDPLYKGGLQGLSVGLAFRLGGLGLFQARAVSLLWGGVLLAFVFLIGQRLYGPLGGVLAALCLGLSRPFLVASHLVRPDVVLAALLAAACYLALRGVQRREAWANLAAGLLLGLALDVHLNALAFMPLIALVYPAYRPAWWRERGTFLFAGGVALGTLYFLLARALPDLGQFAAASSYWIGIDKRPPLLSGDPGRMLAAELGRFAGYFTEERTFELLALLVGFVVAAARAIHGRFLDPLLLGLVAAFAVFVAVVSSKTEFYLVLFYPWLTLLLAGAVVHLARRADHFRTLLVGLVAAAMPLVFGLPDNYEDLSTAASNFSARGYYALVDELRPLIPPDASVLGPPLFWIGLHDHPYTDYYVWERLRAERRERFSSYAARLKPDLLVLDAKSRHQVSINSPGFLERNAVLLKTIRHVGYDRVEVWKLS